MSIFTQPRAARAVPLATLADGVIIRSERFGALVYVRRRDHFYALDPAHASLVQRIRDQAAIERTEQDRIALLAELGICVTAPATPQRAFFGRSLVGDLGSGLPRPSAPMVVNCFATAHCPLQCRYCHADDLMIGYRENEDERWLSQVVDTARATPAMVAVVTGGEPLYQPDRTQRLINALAGGKAIVLDTSGMGDFAALLPTIQRHRVHVRVSLDSADPAVHDALRPINRRYLSLGTSGYAAARHTIEAAVAADVACSVQTVVSARTQAPGRLKALRDLIVDLGVRTWVLHIMVPVGKGARRESAGLLPDPLVEEALRALVKSTANEGIPLDIRVTANHHAPNAVLLINARGELCVEAPGGGGKTMTPVSGPLSPRQAMACFRRRVDVMEHASRYLNGTLEPFPQPTGGTLPTARRRRARQPATPA